MQKKKKSTKMGNKEKTCQSLNKILIFLIKIGYKVMCLNIFKYSHILTS